MVTARAVILRREAAKDFIPPDFGAIDSCLPEPAVERRFYLAARVSIPAARASSLCTRETRSTSPFAGKRS